MKRNKEYLAEIYAKDSDYYVCNYYAFIDGWKAAEKEIKDKYNHYNSKLQEELKPKFGKERLEEHSSRTEKIKELKIKVATLKELL